ncbi:MAG: undecaprenyl-phosphate glucose phosphotransferase [Chitinophagaceae bacterium]
MNQRLVQLIRVSFVLLDLLVLNVVYILTRDFFESTNYSELTYTYLQVVFNVTWLASSWMIGIYNGDNISRFESFCKKTVQAFLYFIPIVMLYLFFSKQTEVSRVFVAVVLVGMSIAFMINRLFHYCLFHVLLKKEFLVKRIIIMGYNGTAKKLSKYLEEQPLKTRIIGFCEKDGNINELTHYPVLGTIESVIQLSKEHKVTDIYSTIAPEQNQEIYNYMNLADQACIRFKFIPNLENFIRPPVHIDYMGQFPMFSTRKEPLDDVANRIKKRIFDLFFSMLVITLLLSWLVPLLGILIKLDSKGPVFFIQKRTGISKKPFSCIKFRSMKLNNFADQQQASKIDLRITRLGRFLRKSNLDELPQFFNVLLSDMSVVGPRPHMLKHTEDYSQLIGKYMVRQLLKPGITGWAQISGFRGETKKVEDMQGRVEHDLWYMENWSLWLDAKIISLTAWNMIRGEKNAF